MIPQSKAKIFPAEERGLAQSDGFKSRYSFNFRQYQHVHKIPFGNLCVLNDDVLAAEQSLHFVAGADMYLVLIPIIGALNFSDNKGCSSELVAGYIQTFTIEKSTSFALSNPYKNEAVNFLQLWIRTDSFQSHIARPVEVNLDKNINGLLTVLSYPQFTISLGKYSGRKEGDYKLKAGTNGIFAFIIDGQMEVQYRLLQSRDGMGLWEQDTIEWEALSATAILLLAEVKL